MRSVRLTKLHEGYQEWEEVVQFVCQELVETEDKSDKLTLKYITEYVLSSIGYRLSSRVLREMLEPLGYDVRRGSLGMMIEGYKLKPDSRGRGIFIRLSKEGERRLEALAKIAGYDTVHKFAIKTLQEKEKQLTGGNDATSN